MTDNLPDISLRAPDPEAMGSIRHIVASAHKWGGDGTKPHFRKIRQVLMRKHPEVIARAFGGNANVAAAWIKNNWYRLRGSEPPPTRGPKAAVSGAIAMDLHEVAADVMEEGTELWCANDKAEKSGGLVWVTALRTGDWRVHPNPAVKGGLKIDKEFLEDVVASYNEGAWEYVTVPTYHTDTDPLANTGFVKKLAIKQRGKHWVLRAGIEFTEPEVEAKVLSGSIAGVSVNVRPNIRNQETGKLFKRVLTHLALTNIPFVSGLNAFKDRIAATADGADPEVIDENDDFMLSYELVPDDATWDEALDELTAYAEPAEGWDVEKDFEYVRQQLQAAIGTGYFLDEEGDLVGPDGIDTDGEHETGPLSPAQVRVVGLTPSQALVHACSASADADPSYYSSSIGDANGVVAGWVVGYDVSADGELTLDPIDEWQYVEKKWVVADATTSATNGGQNVSISGEQWFAFTLMKSESSRGGDDDMNENEKKDEKETPAPTPDAPVTLTREDAERMAEEKAQEMLTAYRAEQEERETAQQTEIAAMRRSLHEKDVKEKVSNLVAAGHTPAVVALAKEIMLADETGAEVLSLSRTDEDGTSSEVKLSATEIVSELLASIPATALTNNIETPDLSVKTDDAKARADALYDSLYGENASAVTILD